MKTLNQLAKIYFDKILPSSELNSTDKIINLLKNALKEELCAWYGYIIVKEWLTGLCRPEIEKFYEETAKDELEDHAYWIMKRLAQLNATIEDITLSPASMLEAQHKYLPPVWSDGNINIIESIKTNIQNEEGAIETYKELVAVTEEIDPVTNAKCKEILADEEDHLQELNDFLNDIAQQTVSAEI